MEFPEGHLVSTTLLNSIPATIVIYVPVWNEEHSTIVDFKISFCNEAACQFLGASVEDLLGARLSSLPYLDSDARAAALEDCRAAWNSDGQVVDHYFNEVRDVYLEIVRIRKGDQIICVFKDQTHKFRAELERKIAAEELDTIFNASLSALYLAEVIYDGENKVCDLRFLRVNRAYLKITHQNYADLIGKKLSEVSPATLTTDFLENIEIILRTNSEEIFEVHYPQTGRYFNFSGVKLSSDRIVVTFNNITRQKQAEQALKEQFRLTEALLDSSLHAICAHKIIRNEAGEFEDLEFVKVNKMAEDILGLSEDVIGKRWLSVYPGAGESETFEVCKQVIETGVPARREMRYEANGLNGWFDYSLVKLPHDGLMVTIADITESKSNQLKALEAKQFLQNLIDGTSTGMVLLEKVGNDKIDDFRVKAVNRNVTASMNTSPDELIGGYFTQVFPGFKENGHFDKYKLVFETGEELNFEYEHHAEGYSVWLDVIARKIGEEVLISFNDITYLKELTLELKSSITELRLAQEHESQLRQLNEYKDEFLNIASHELKTPITTIKACLQILGKNTVFPKNTSEFYERAKKNIATLERLIGELLDVSKASVGKLTVVKESIDAAQLIDEAVESFRNSHPSRKISEHLEISGEVSADWIRLEQVLNNIIGNALKYSDGDIIIRAFEEERCLQIWVQDFGKGIADEELDNLFNRFYRSAATRHIQGLGLGLYLSQQIMISHGGRIEVESVVNEGSLFKIILPL